MCRYSARRIVGIALRVSPLPLRRQDPVGASIYRLERKGDDVLAQTCLSSTLTLRSGNTGKFAKSMAEHGKVDSKSESELLLLVEGITIVSKR